MKGRNHGVLACLAVALIMSAPVLMAQKTWHANAGAESFDQAVQGDGFFPNELWITAGDSIQWTFVPKNEPHTVTFLAEGAVRPVPPPPIGPPPPPAGPPFAFDPACLSTQSYTGTNCVSSGVENGGTTFTVTFPNPGLYKLVCLIHTDMNGAVHVLSKGTNLPHSQAFYTSEGAEQAFDLTGAPWQSQKGQNFPSNSNANTVLAGTGQIVGTGGGTQYRAVVRFINPTITIQQGESVTWTNIDPTEPHTVTFGTEPVPFNPMAQVGLGATVDGTLTGAVSSTSTFLNSGFIQTQAPDRAAPAAGDNQLPIGTTRITITFPNPGTFQYHCALHDIDGMNGTVIVRPVQGQGQAQGKQ
jgi:plastocyanin